MKIRQMLLVILAMSPTPTFARAPFTTATCSNSNLSAGIVGRKTVGNQTVYVRRLATIKDEAMDDFGNTAPGDNLELFCVSSGQTDALGVMAGCLSNESCPWR